MRLVVLGPPGAGKSTQAQRVAGKHGIPHLPGGDMLRAAVASGTRVGVLAKDTMARGGLVSDDIVQAIVFERLDRSDARTDSSLMATAPDLCLYDRALRMNSLVSKAS